MSGGRSTHNKSAFAGSHPLMVPPIFAAHSSGKHTGLILGISYRDSLHIRLHRDPVFAMVGIYTCNSQSIVNL